MRSVIENTIAEFDKVTAEAKSLFGNLSTDQLNWKPSAEKWSIAQCLDHLIVSNSTYYPQFDEVASGKHKNSFYQNIKFISKFFGDYLIKETGAVVAKPMQSPAAFVPSQSEIAGTIVLDFEKHQQKFSATIQQLEKIDLEKTIISSPALKIITYSLSNVLTIFVGHEQRHLTQAKNVLKHESFPKK